MADISKVTYKNLNIIDLKFKVNCFKLQSWAFTPSMQISNGSFQNKSIRKSNSKDLSKSAAVPAYQKRSEEKFCLPACQSFAEGVTQLL